MRLIGDSSAPKSSAQYGPVCENSVLTCIASANSKGLDEQDQMLTRCSLTVDMLVMVMQKLVHAARLDNFACLITSYLFMRAAKALESMRI